MLARVLAAFSSPKAFLCSLAILAGSGFTSQANDLGVALSGTLSFSESVGLGRDFTNYFRAEFGTNSYLVELFDLQSNLLCQARCDGRDVSYWWGAADPKASSTVLITSLSNFPVQGPPLRYPEELVVRPLLWTVPGLCPQLADLFRRADSNPDFLAMVNANQYPQGFDKVDTFDPQHHLAQRKFIAFQTSSSAAGKPLNLYLVDFTNYIKVGEVSIPSRFTIADLRMGRFISRTYEVAVDRANFGPLPPFPDFLDGLPGRIISVMDHRNGHIRDYVVDNAVKNSELAPDFTAMTFVGQSLKLSDYRGKYVLLDFWATWCGPCIAELPNIKSVFDAYGNNPRFAILGLSLDTDSAAAAKFVQAQHMAWPQLLLGDIATNSVTKAYGVDGIPKLFLIDPDGRIIARELRGPDIEKAVSAALPAK